MMQRRTFLSSVLFFLVFPMPSFAAGGDSCSDFLKLPASEQRQYLKGYTLGAAMEMQYFKNNLLNSHVSKALKEPADNQCAPALVMRDRTPSLSRALG